jgi:hypothetical protein
MAVMSLTASLPPDPIERHTCLPPQTKMASQFVFASSPWVNLHNFLVREGKRVRGFDDDGLGARGYLAEDTASVRPLSAAEQERWNRAVEFFARVELPGRLGIDSLLQNISNPLAAAAPNGDLDDVPLHPELRRVLRETMPIYRATWWPAHDARNQRWIADMRSLLAVSESCLKPRAENVLKASWPAGSVYVDASVYANWFGAYSTHNPTHITVSANALGSQRAYGLEILIHETGHAMLGTIDSALAAESIHLRKALPSELSHLALFYLAGAIVKEQQPDHVPFAEAFGIWRRNDASRRYHELIEAAWRPYLSGARSFSEAISATVRALPSDH